MLGRGSSSLDPAFPGTDPKVVLIYPSWLRVSQLLWRRRQGTDDCCGPERIANLPTAALYHPDLLRVPGASLVFRKVTAQLMKSISDVGSGVPSSPYSNAFLFPAFLFVLVFFSRQVEKWEDKVLDSGGVNLGIYSLDCRP